VVPIISVSDAVPQLRVILSTLPPPIVSPSTKSQTPAGLFPTVTQSMESVSSAVEFVPDEVTYTATAVLDTNDAGPETS